MIRPILKTLFSLLGFKIEKVSNIKPIDIRNDSNNPRAVFYENYFQYPVLIDAKLEYGRGLDIYSLANDSIHPFITSIRLSNPVKRESIKNILSNYYRTTVPKNPLHWLGASDWDKDSELAKSPSWNTLLPWENVSLERKAEERKICAIQDNQEHGGNLSIEHGWRNFGPVSTDVLELEVDRIWKLFNSMSKKGFVRSDGSCGDIGAVILQNSDGMWRWLVEAGGQHRAALVAALGYKTVPIRVWKVVNRDDVELWPAVRKGYFSKKQALEVFDYIFHAKVEKSNNGWTAYLKDTQ